MGCVGEALAFTVFWLMPAGAPGRASEAVSKREQSNSSETKYDYMFEGLYTEIFKELNDELTM